MFFKSAYHIWKSVFLILWYRGLKSLIPDSPTLLWWSWSQAGWRILHWEKKSRSLIRYCPRKVYWTILHCRLGRISRNALTRVYYIYCKFKICPVSPGYCLSFQPWLLEYSSLNILSQLRLVKWAWTYLMNRSQVDLGWTFNPLISLINKQTRWKKQTILRDEVEQFRKKDSW